PFNLGEQHHNYHHRFCSDYRNGVRAWEFDPTKWLIWGLCRMGLAYDLKRMPRWRIEKAKTEAALKRLAKRVVDDAEKRMPQLLKTRDAFIQAYKAWEDTKQNRQPKNRVKQAARAMQTQRQVWLSHFSQAMAAA